MPSSSGSSDVNLEIVSAREEHYVSHRSSTPSAKYRVDSVDLDGMGAHIPLSSRQSYPEVAEITDDEDSSVEEYCTSFSSDNSPQHRVLPMIADLEYTASGSTHTSEVASHPFLSPIEFNEFLRRLPSDRTLGKRSSHSSEVSPTRLSLPDRAIEYRTQRCEIAERDRQGYSAFSASHTAPPGSVYTVDQEDCVAEYQPGLDDPWSPAGPGSGCTGLRRPECPTIHDSSWTL